MTNLDNIEIGTADLENLSEIVCLINKIQPHLNYSEKLLYWQYFGQPDVPSKIYTMRDQKTGTLVSMYAAVGQHLKIGGKKMTARMVQNVMTLPEYCGRGFLHHLAEICLNDIKETGEMGYTFPNELSHRSFFRTGWSRLYPIPSREKNIDGSKATKPSLMLDHLEGDFPKDVTEIWNDSGLLAGVDRNAPFLNWRYSKPGEQYSRFITSDKKGFLIVKLFDDGARKIAHILDLVVQKDCQELIRPLLSFVEYFAFSSGANKVTCWLAQDHVYHKIFDEAGFVLGERPERFVYLYTRGVEINANDWHITQGDSDVY